MASGTLRSSTSLRRSLNGEPAGGGLSRKHQGVGAVEDGVGDVRSLGARGPRLGGHRFQHLRRRDNRDAHRIGSLDDPLLDHRDRLWRQFDAQVAARHHHRVRDAKDFIQPVNGFGFFQLGDDRDTLARPLEDALQLHDVFRAANKREGDIVYVLLDAKPEVCAIFFGQGRDAEGNAGQVDALVLAQFASVDHAAEDVASGDALYAKLDAAIRKQDTAAGPHLGGEGAKVGRNAAGIAGERTRSESDRGA
jgi:hypothetical protein